MRQRFSNSSGVVVTLLVGAFLGGSLALIFRPGLYNPYDEADTYLYMARGGAGPVYSYYSQRVLHPLFVGWVARLAHMPVDARVFLWVSAGSLLALFVWLGISYGLSDSWTGSFWLLLVATATLVDAYRNYYWHDLFYVSLCALFFVLLRANKWAGLPILFALYMTRETSVVLAIVLVLVAVMKREWLFSAGALFVAAAATIVDSSLLARATPNHHGISLLLLDVLKMPYNFAYNLCGIEFWTNTNASTLLPPVWTVSVPAWLHLGNIRQVGYAGFFWQEPARTLLSLATAFGILPLVVIRRALDDGRRLLEERFDLVIAFLYGVLMFVLAPLTGTLPARYVFYAWPVFWLFGVSALDKSSLTPRRRVSIVLVSICTAWIPCVIRLVTGPPIEGPESIVTVVTTGGLILSLVAVAAIYAWAWRFLGPTLRGTSEAR